MSRASSYDEGIHIKIEQLFKEAGERVLFSLKVIDSTKQTLHASPRKKFTEKLSGASFMDITGKSGNDAGISSKKAGSFSNLHVFVTSPQTASQTNKKIRYVVLTMKTNSKVRLHKLKYQSSNASIHVGKTWSLDEIKSIENFSSGKFSINFSKTYNWLVEEPHLKVEFLYILLKLCLKSRKVPKLVNLSESILKDELETYKLGIKMTDDDTAAEEEEDGVETSPRTSLNDALLQVQFNQEDLKIDEVLLDYNWKVDSDASALENRLMDELAALEAANLHSIIQADEQSGKIFSLFDYAIAELEKIDEWLGLYHSELMNTGKDIQHIENQNKGLQIQTTNQKQLKIEMDRLMNALSLADKTTECLKSESLEAFDGIEKLETACKALQSALQLKLDDSLQEISAVRERIAWFGTQSGHFSQRLVEHLSKLIFQECSVYGEHHKVFSGTDVRINSCESLAGLLFSYRKLVEWMKEVEPRRLNELQLLYVQDLNRIYKSSFHECFETLRSRAVKKLAEEPSYLFVSSSKGFFSGGSVLNPISNVKSPSMVSIISKTHKRGASNEAGYSLSPAVEDKHGKIKSKIGESTNSLETEERINPVEAYESFFRALMPILIREQNFLIDFYHFPGCLPSDISSDELLDSIDKCRPSQKDLKTKKKLEDLMETLFDGLSVETLTWFETALKVDVSFVVGLLVVLEANMTLVQDGQIVSQYVPFLESYITSMQEKLHGLYERFIDDQLKAIEETKLTLRSRSGILLFVKIFPKFVARLDSFFKGVPEQTEMRKTINSCYNKFINLIFDNLHAIAKDVDSQMPSDDREQLNAHILIIENMHHLHSELRILKISTLEQHMKTAKAQYEFHLNSYIKAVVRKPLGKLLSFFEGMEELLKTKHPEEIPYHLNFNKASIKKCLISFPGKEVKKSIETLFKRVSKHFCEEEGLLQVVWHGIQEEFIRLHQQFESLIRTCYSETDIHLFFSVDDLCGYFSEIAKNA